MSKPIDTYEVEGYVCYKTATLDVCFYLDKHPAVYAKWLAHRISRLWETEDMDRLIRDARSLGVDVVIKPKGIIGHIQKFLMKAVWGV